MEHKKTHTESTTQPSVAATGPASPASPKTFVLPASKPATVFDCSKFDASMLKPTTPNIGDSEAPKIPVDMGARAPAVPAADLAKVTNADFIEAVFGKVQKGNSALICSDWRSHSWWVDPKASGSGARVCSEHEQLLQLFHFKPDPDGTYHARKDSADGYQCLMLDDVGTKAARNGLGDFTPSWAIETSPG